MKRCDQHAWQRVMSGRSEAGKPWTSYRCAHCVATKIERSNMTAIWEPA